MTRSVLGVYGGRGLCMNEVHMYFLIVTSLLKGIQSLQEYRFKIIPVLQDCGSPWVVSGSLLCCKHQVN